MSILNLHLWVQGSFGNDLFLYMEKTNLIFLMFFFSQYFPHANFVHVTKTLNPDLFFPFKFATRFQSIIFLLNSKIPLQVCSFIQPPRCQIPLKSDFSNLEDGHVTLRVILIWQGSRTPQCYALEQHNHLQTCPSCIGI